MKPLFINENIEKSIPFTNDLLSQSRFIFFEIMFLYLFTLKLSFL